MNSLNSVLIEGNLTHDPELTTTPKGTPVCTFSIGSNRYYKSDDEFQEEVSFFDVETWSRLAERCGDQLEKGRGVRVVGRLKQDKWNDKEGNPHSRVKIVAEHVEFRSKRELDEGFAEEQVDSDEALREEERETVTV
jgi:single-strand DNA-binding protein